MGIDLEKVTREYVNKCGEVEELKKINESHRMLNGELMGDNKHLNDLLNQALKDYDELQQKLCDIEKIVNQYSTNDYYYKYNNRYLKSEIIENLLEILRGDCNE